MGKVIVITGASSGFGKGVVERLAADGHSVVLAARRDHLLDEVAASLPDALAVPTDVSRPDETERLAERALATYGRIDVWINNAGVGAVGPFTEIPLVDQIRVVETNLIGELNGSHVALRHFLERGEGTLINVASIAGKIAMPYYAVYGGTKAAIQAIGAAIRRELELKGQENIHICTVNPWATDTPFFAHASNYTGHSLRMPAIDDPEVVINAIVDLLDDPKDEVDVGFKTRASVIGSHLTPAATEAATARITEKYLMEDAPEAPVISGAVHTPMDTPSVVEGGVRERIEAEDEMKDR